LSGPDLKRLQRERRSFVTGNEAGGEEEDGGRALGSENGAKDEDEHEDEHEFFLRSTEEGRLLVRMRGSTSTSTRTI
jgi:hypothetical protein